MAGHTVDTHSPLLPMCQCRPVALSAAGRLAQLTSHWPCERVETATGDRAGCHGSWRACEDLPHITPEFRNLYEDSKDKFTGARDPRRVLHGARASCETANRARSELPLTEARRAGGIVGNVIRSRQPRRRRWRGVPSRAGPRGERSTMRA